LQRDPTTLDQHGIELLALALVGCLLAMKSSRLGRWRSLEAVTKRSPLPSSSSVSGGPPSIGQSIAKARTPQLLLSCLVSNRPQRTEDPGAELGVSAPGYLKSLEELFFVNPNEASSSTQQVGGSVVLAD
jgi:hypothetical protein